MLLRKKNLETFETFRNILRKETQYMYIHLYIYKSLMDLFLPLVSILIELMEE